MHFDVKKTMREFRTQLDEVTCPICEKGKTQTATVHFKFAFSCGHELTISFKDFIEKVMEILELAGLVEREEQNEVV